MTHKWENSSIEQKTQWTIDLYYRPDIVNEIKNKMLEWASHVWMKPETITKIILQEDNLREKDLCEEPKYHGSIASREM